jgi:hypothetical protein
MGIAYNPRIVTNGLVLALDAGNIKSYPGSGTTWTDLSGNGNNGTLINGVGYSGDNLGSLVFDGVNDEVNADLGNSLVKDFTLDFWMKSSAVVEGRGMVEYGGSTYAIIAAYRLLPNFCTFYWGTTSATTSLTLNTANLADNKWHQVTQTYDGTNARVYVDGDLKINDSSTFSGNLRNTSNKQINIGRWRGSGIFQDGNISSVKVYNRALTEQEIQQNFNALRSRFSI